MRRVGVASMIVMFMVITIAVVLLVAGHDSSIVYNFISITIACAALRFVCHGSCCPSVDIGSSSTNCPGKWLLTQDLFQIVVADPPGAMEVEEVKELLEHQKQLLLYVCM